MKASDYQSPRTAEEVIRRYQNGERDFGESSLDEVAHDFRGALLEEITFAPDTFLLADFRGSKLKGADFSNCNVKTCDFRGADLREANFTNAAIDSATFEGADLEGADFAGAPAHGY